MKWFTAAALLLALAGPTSAALDWVNDGVKVHGNNTEAQFRIPAVVGTATGIFTASVHDDSGDGHRVLVQKFNKCGTKQFGNNGVRPDNVTGDINFVDMIDDGAGGVIVAWQKGNPGDVYVQRYDPQGNPLWTAGGINLSFSDENDIRPKLLTDKNNGCIVVWEQLGTTRYILGQRVVAGGFMVWNPWGGKRMTTGTTDEILTDLVYGSIDPGVTDAIIGFYRGTDHFAVKVDDNGDPLWSSAGVLASGTDGINGGGAIAPDNQGGVYVAFQVLEGGGTFENIRIAKIGVGGTVSQSFEVGALGAYDYAPVMQAVGANKLHVAYAREGIVNTGYMVQIWNNNVTETQISSPGTGSVSPSDLAYDGQGASVVVWTDGRNATQDVYAAHFNGSSLSEWGGPSGKAVCTATGSQNDPVIAPIAYNHWTRSDFAVVWIDDRANWERRVYAQRLEGHNGVWGNADPKIGSIYDCDGADEGGCLGIEWIRSQVDGPLLPFDPPNPVVNYSFWRAVDVLPLFPPDPVCVARGTHEHAGQTCPWEWVANYDAFEAETYFTTLPTTRDAAPGDPAMHYFVILAEDEIGGYYISAVDSGASHDEIAPSEPGELNANQVGSWAYLDWLPVPEPDLAFYRIYRGNGPNPLLHLFSLVGTATTTEFTDENYNPGANHHYRVVAVDDNGNASVPSTIVGPIHNPTGTPTVAPQALALQSPYPNPFNGTTSLRVGLPEQSDLRVDVFDVAGRKVYSETRRNLQRGWHDLEFAGRNSRDARLASGVYFYRVRAAGTVLTRKLVISR